MRVPDDPSLKPKKGAGAATRAEAWTNKPKKDFASLLADVKLSDIICSGFSLYRGKLDRRACVSLLKKNISYVTVVGTQRLQKKGSVTGADFREESLRGRFSRS